MESNNGSNNGEPPPIGFISFDQLLWGNQSYFHKIKHNFSGPAIRESEPRLSLTIDRPGHSFPYQHTLFSFLFNFNHDHDLISVNRISEINSSEKQFHTEFLYKFGSIFITVYLLAVTTFLATKYVGRKCPKWIRRLSLTLLVNLTLVILLPGATFLYTILLVYRSLLSRLYFRWWLKDTTNIKLMDPMDVVWAGQRTAQCNYFTSLYILQGKVNVPDMQQRILNQLIYFREEKTGELIYDRLRYCVRRHCGFYCWEEDKEFNVTKHVRLIDPWSERSGQRADLDRPYSESDIFEVIEKVADTPMSVNRPQWEILIVPKFVYDDDKNENEVKHKVKFEYESQHYAIIFRIHHCIMDGVSAGHVLKHFLADTPIKFSVDPLKPLKYSKVQKLLIYVHALIFGATEVLKSLNLDDTNCFHQGTLTGPKKFGWSRPIRMDALKKVKQKTGTTTTAVLMSSIGGAIRKLAMDKGLSIPRRLQGATTVALLPYPDIRPRNRFVLVHFPLETGLGSCGERLEAAHEAAVKLSTSSHALVYFLTHKLGGRLPAVMGDYIMSLLRATLILSNVPGPSEPATLFGGHLLTDGVFWVPLKNWTGLGACLFSYHGRVRAAFVGDKSSVSDPTDVARLIKNFEHEIVQLSQNAGLSSDAIFWTPAPDPGVNP